MDVAVRLVESYLHANGYFTVTEYPVIVSEEGRYTEATDIDLMAFRFPAAGRSIPGRAGEAGTRAAFQPDPELRCPPDQGDMIIAEVKEGRAEVSPKTFRREVLRVALVRFGCCLPDRVEEVVDALVRTGRARTGMGHQVRIVAFGSVVEPGAANFTAIPLAHVVDFLRDHLATHWKVLGSAHFRDETLGLLALLRKSRREPGRPGG